MDPIMFKIFVCLAFPISLMMLAIRGKVRTQMLFLLFGLTAGLLAGIINTTILTATGVSRFYLTVNYSPVIEEMLKALPLLVFAFGKKPEKQSLLEAAISCGIGFAIFENTCLFGQRGEEITMFVAVMRGIGSGMMHSICTVLVAYGISLFVKHKKWFFPGTVAILILATNYHSLYNILIQSKYLYLGVVLTTVGYAATLTVMYLKKRHRQAVQ